MPAGGLQTGKGSNQGSSPDLFNKNIGQGRDSNKAGSGTGSGPQPLDKREGSGKAPGSSGNGDVPSPERARGNHNPGIPGLMPTVAPQSGTSNRPLNEPGEGKRNTTPTMAEPDFSAYMAELQRKIKRGWFPPRAPGSIKTQVVFKIHTNGELSDLRIKQSSGIAINDQAALKAVESSAPFKHLPANSPENVDIEFTFDYNVFSGRTF